MHLSIVRPTVGERRHPSTGEGHSTFMWTGGGGGGAARGRKPDPIAMCSVHINHPVTIYLITKKKSYMHTLSQYCTVAGAQSVGLSQTYTVWPMGTPGPGKQPCDKRSNPPVAN